MSETLSRRRSFAQVPDDLAIDKRLSDRAVRLWVRLDKYAGKDGAAFPSRERLAADIGCSVASIKRAFGELVAAGWVTRTRRSTMANIWDTVLNDVSTKPQSSDEPAGQDGRVTDDPSRRSMGDPSGGSQETRLGKETQRKETQSKDRSFGHGAPAGVTRKRATVKRKPTKLTDAEHREQWDLLKDLCEQEGQDDPVSVWWTLRHEHHAIRPGAFLADLIDKGQWDGFVGSHGIGEYLSNGMPA